MVSQWHALEAPALGLAEMNHETPSAPSSGEARVLLHEQSQQQGQANHPQSFWLWAMCLTGVDYFSTLGYQPSIAFTATGYLCPLATIAVVLVTLFGALPIYSFIARHSHEGMGSLGLLTSQIRGWHGKIIVLILLGFAATDFVITKTLSAADAAAHVINNPMWTHTDPGKVRTDLDFRLSQSRPDWAEIPESQKDELRNSLEAKTKGNAQIIITSGLLLLLGIMFLRGFREVIGLAVGITSVYLLLNAVILWFCLEHIFHHPELIEEWIKNLTHGPEGWYPAEWQRHHAPDLGFLGSAGAIIVSCLLLFPKLALGLSGFETGVAIMPLIRGAKSDTPDHPEGRIASTQRLLLTAALIMSVMLLASSVSVTMLIPADDLVNPGGEELPARAKDRALSYFAHGESRHVELSDGVHPVFGKAFGTIYDISTIVILWFAGASAMAALINLVPKYLPKYGMAPEWTKNIPILVVLFTAINLFVTWVFDARVDKQGDAYATGVLVLILSACVASVIEVYLSRSEQKFIFRFHPYYCLVSVVFGYTLLAILIEKPVGLKIAFFFILAILILSFGSRLWRTTELRFDGFDFIDEHTRDFLYPTFLASGFQVLVPHRPGRRQLDSKEVSIRKEHRIADDTQIAFIEVKTGDPSDFKVKPIIGLDSQEGRTIVKISRCPSIPHVIAGLALEMSKDGRNPPEIHFGWSDESPLTANLKFVFFGEGNIPWLVRELIRRNEPDETRQPRVVIG